LRHVDLGDEEVALADEGRIDPQAEARSPAPTVARMSQAGSGWPSDGAVVGGIDLVRRTHDLGTAPSLVDAQVGDKVAGLHAAVGTDAREDRVCTGNADPANSGGRREATRYGRAAC